MGNEKNLFAAPLGSRFDATRTAYGRHANAFDAVNEIVLPGTATVGGRGCSGVRLDHCLDEPQAECHRTGCMRMRRITFGQRRRSHGLGVRNSEDMTKPLRVAVVGRCSEPAVEPSAEHGSSSKARHADQPSRSLRRLPTAPRQAATRNLRHDWPQRGDHRPAGPLFRVTVALGRRSSFGCQFRTMHPAVLARPIGTRSPPGPRGMGTVDVPPRSEPSFPQRPQPPDRGRQANPESLTHEPGPRHPELLRDPVEIAQLAPGHVQLDGPIERLGVGFIDRSHAASTPRAGRQHLAVSLRDATDQVQVVACFKQSVDAHGVRASSRSSISSQEYAEFGGTRDPRVSASHHTHLVLRHD